MKKKETVIISAFIGYSDGSGEKDSFKKKHYPELSYPNMPERVFAYFTSVYTMRKLPEAVLNSDVKIQIDNWCYGKPMTRGDVIDFIGALDSEGDRQKLMQKLADISEYVQFMLVVLHGNDPDVESVLNTKPADEQYGHRMVEDCIQYEWPVPMSSHHFPVYEPEVELGYVRGVFTGDDTPFFAKLWRSEQSSIKYVTIVLLMFGGRRYTHKYCNWPAKLIRKKFDVMYFGSADDSDKE